MTLSTTGRIFPSSMKATSLVSASLDIFPACITHFRGMPPRNSGMVWAILMPMNHRIMSRTVPPPWMRGMLPPKTKIPSGFRYADEFSKIE